MYQQLTDIRLMAFVVAFKRLRRNSVIYRHEKKYILAQKLGMSAVTIGKYIARCESLGLIIPHHEDRKFAKLTTCIKVLFPAENIIAFKHVRFFRGEEPTTNHKQVAEVIKFALAKNNFKKQQHFISRKAVIDEIGKNRTNTKTLKVLKSLARKSNCEITELPRICQRTNHILTGKYHLSRIIGCSPSTAVNLLRKWDAVGLITRTIITKRIDAPVNHATFDYYKSHGCKYLQPLKSGQGYFNTYGSQVSIFV